MSAAIVVTCSECLRPSRVAHSQLEQFVAMAMYWEDVGFDARTTTAHQAWELCRAKESYLDEARAFLGTVAQ